MFGSFEARRGYHHGDGGIVRLVNTCGRGHRARDAADRRSRSTRSARCSATSSRRVVPHERLMEEAELVARQILRNSQIAVRSAKETILDVIGRPLDEQLRIEALNALRLRGPRGDAGAAPALLRQDRRGPGRRQHERTEACCDAPANSGVKALVTGAARGIGAAIAQALRERGHGGRDDRPRRGLRPSPRRCARSVPGPRRRRRVRAERRDHDHDRARAPHERRAVAARHRREPDRRLPRRCRPASAGCASAATAGSSRSRAARPSRGLPGQVAYSASKAGLIGMVRTIAAENVARGITANAVLPGFVETENVRAMPADVLERVTSDAAGGPDGGAVRGRGAGGVPRLARGRLRHRPGDRDRRRPAAEHALDHVMRFFSAEATARAARSRARAASRSRRSAARSAAPASAARSRASAARS